MSVLLTQGSYPMFLEETLNQYHEVKNLVPSGPSLASQGQEEEGAVDSGFGQEAESAQLLKHRS